MTEQSPPVQNAQYNRRLHIIARALVDARQVSMLDSLWTLARRTRDVAPVLQTLENLAHGPRAVIWRPVLTFVTEYQQESSHASSAIISILRSILAECSWIGDDRMLAARARAGNRQRRDQ